MVHVVDHDVRPGVELDIRDAWPGIPEQVMSADGR